jgi:hypothetical protein
MRMDDMILVSIDDHMIEPPDMYRNRALAADVDTARMPRAEWRKRNMAAGFGVF